jgi:catechol 2,3-dioxygenase-like lactoylglutathione lyase family enzyme
MPKRRATPRFAPGANIAVKVPASRYDETVAFYRDVLGLASLDSHAEYEVFDFGGVRLWLDRVPHATHPEIWLEVRTDDADRGAQHLAAAGARITDEIEPLCDMAAHWVMDPAGTVLLLSQDADIGT